MCHWGHVWQIYGPLFQDPDELGRVMMAAYIKPRASEYISRGFIYGRSDVWLNLILIVLHLSFLTLFIISFWFMLFSCYTRLLSIILTWKLVIKCSYYIIWSSIRWLPHRFYHPGSYYCLQTFFRVFYQLVRPLITSYVCQSKPINPWWTKNSFLMLIKSSLVYLFGAKPQQKLSHEALRTERV